MTREQEIRERVDANNNGPQSVFASTYRAFVSHASGDLAYLLAENQRLREELAHWKVCMNCGEALVAPGICDKAVSESEKGLELMLNEAFDMRDQQKARAEAAEAQHVAAQAQVESACAVLLGEKVSDFEESFPLIRGILDLQSEVEAAEAQLAEYQQIAQEYDALLVKRENP